MKKDHRTHKNCQVFYIRQVLATFDCRKAERALLIPPSEQIHNLLPVLRLRRREKFTRHSVLENHHGVVLFFW